MPFQLTPIDRSLAESVVLDLTGGAGLPGRGGIVQFQFPPVISKDNKGANYKKIDAKNVEPMAQFMGGKPREITLKWTYIVTGAKNFLGIDWTAAGIAEQVKRIRGYFYATVFEGLNPETNLIIQFRAYHIVGAGAGTYSFRAEGIDIKHSPTIVTDTDDGAQYPLRTDLSMSLKLWSLGEDKEGRPLYKLPGLKALAQLTPEWL